MVCITYQYVVCMHVIYYACILLYSACIDDYAILLTYVHAIYLKNFQVIALLDMVCITYQYVVCHVCYICTDIMHASYYIGLYR